jgi:hypothetical protein
METIIRHVRDIEGSERRLLEQVIGQQLQENQKVIIQVVTLDALPKEGAIPAERLPNWCNVYEGLTEKELAEVEEVILQRSDLTRPSE